jgi:beta-lactamase class A
MARVNRSMADLGYQATRVQRTMLDTAAQQRGLENYVSADDLAAILDGARRGTLLADAGPAIPDRVLALLRERGASDRDWLGLRLETGWRLAHINGTLDAVRNDAGIISGPDGREADLVICQDRLTNAARGEQRIAEAAAKAWFRRSGSDLTVGMR